MQGASVLQDHAVERTVAILQLAEEMGGGEAGNREARWRCHATSSRMRKANQSNSAAVQAAARKLG